MFSLLKAMCTFNKLTIAQVINISLAQLRHSKSLRVNQWTRLDLYQERYSLILNLVFLSQYRHHHRWEAYSGLITWCLPRTEQETIGPKATTVRGARLLRMFSSKSGERPRMQTAYKDSKSPILWGAEQGPALAQ